MQNQKRGINITNYNTISSTREMNNIYIFKNSNLNNNKKRIITIIISFH
jgi:hypothetical protein